MPSSTLPDLPIYNENQAKRLGGKLWSVGGATYRFKDYQKGPPNTPGWGVGGEGKAYRLLNPHGEVVAYLKSFDVLNCQRRDRTAWLINRQIHTWDAGLRAAPQLWADTRTDSRPDGIDFDFAGCLAAAVPGKEWEKVKAEIVEVPSSWELPLRWRCCFDLIRSLAILEREGIIHGDLSPTNIIVDVYAPEDPVKRALYLIDFDAFFSEWAGPVLKQVTVGKRTFGTSGYCPPDLEKRDVQGDSTVAPYSDRYGRDMLLLELVCAHLGFSHEDPPREWDRAQLLARYRELERASREVGIPPEIFDYLAPQRVFDLTEDRRLSSAGLAQLLALPLAGARNSGANTAWPTLAPRSLPLAGGGNSAGNTGVPAGTTRAGSDPKGKAAVGTLVGAGVGALPVGLLWAGNWLLLKALGLVLPAVAGEVRFGMLALLLGAAWLLLGVVIGLLLFLISKGDDNPAVLLPVLGAPLLGAAGACLLLWPWAGLGAMVVCGVIGALTGYTSRRSS